MMREEKGCNIADKMRDISEWRIRAVAGPPAASAKSAYEGMLKKKENAYYGQTDER